MMVRHCLAAVISLLLASSAALAGNTNAHAGKARACKSQVSQKVAGTTQTWSVKVDGQTRFFNVHFPDGFKRRGRNDLVIIYHGYGDAAESFEVTTGLSETADEHGFIVVYPDALPTEFVGSADLIATWNDLSTSGSPGPEGTACDPDNPFLSPVAESCAADPHRDI